MEKQKTNRREWVKTVVIIFLVIMLVLTFFSNTIMNRSLPEVAAQYVQSGAINARIRGTGAVSANETYDVTLSQTRKIRSVLVRVGDEVQAGDVLLSLEPMDSEELKQAQQTLVELELAYQKSLIAASNSDATENYAVQKLQKEYDEALKAYRLYSDDDPDVLILKLEQAEIEQQYLDQLKTDIAADLASAQQDPDYLKAKADQSTYQAQYDAAQAEYEGYLEQQQKNRELELEIEYQEDMLQRHDQYGRDKISIYSDYDVFLKITGDTSSDPEVCAYNLEFFLNRMPDSSVPTGYSKEEYAQRLQEAYRLAAPIMALRSQLLGDAEAYALQQNLDRAATAVNQAENDLAWANSAISTHESIISGIQANLDEATRMANEQAAVVSALSKASQAAEALKIAEQALEDKVFETGLSDSASLDLQHAKDEVDQQKAVVEALSAESDGQEITANVSGVVSNIHVTAGNTAGAETPVVTITVADRGYTVRIPVTLEQARQVKIGDTAEITNFWNGNITATLENIINDPQNPSSSKLLMFRLSGDGIEPGTNLTLSIGQRSANYDALIPNSAVRTDANGSFVLVVTAKPSPLGNRYVATRADVQILASDDTMSAVSGLANGDFVITTSSVPIEAGNQVRLVDNE